MILKIIAIIVLLIIIISRTSGVGFILYSVALYVALKGLSVISSGTPIMFNSIDGFINAGAMLYTILIIIVGIDSIYSNK